MPAGYLFTVMPHCTSVLPLVSELQTAFRRNAPTDTLLSEDIRPAYSLSHRVTKNIIILLQKKIKYFIEIFFVMCYYIRCTEFLTE